MSPVHLVIHGLGGGGGGACQLVISCYADTAVMPCKHFPSNIVCFRALCVFRTMSENTAAQPSLVELRVYTALCFLFGRERQNWAFSQLELGDRCRLSAGYDGSCSFNERPSKKHRKEKKARQTLDK